MRRSCGGMALGAHMPATASVTLLPVARLRGRLGARIERVADYLCFDGVADGRGHFRARGSIASISTGRRFGARQRVHVPFVAGAASEAAHGFTFVQDEGAAVRAVFRLEARADLYGRSWLLRAGELVR